MLGEVVGQMYVEKYFPAAAKERMVTLVKNLQTSLGERINALEWMSEPTKAKAQEKAGYLPCQDRLSRYLERLLSLGY